MFCDPCLTNGLAWCLTAWFLLSGANEIGTCNWGYRYERFREI